MRTFSKVSGAPPRQRGVVLIFALIALAILMIGAVAVMRSMNTAQFSIGNLGFKRDMANQAERAMTRVQANFVTGPLAGLLARESNLPGSNYSAVMLQTNAQGLPLALLGNDTAFGAVGATSNDITTDLGVTIRYVVDRLSNTPGPCSLDTCVISASDTTTGGSAGESGVLPVPQPLYRLTVRVKGPRGTQSFFQSTFTY